jgi:IS4 transposase
MPTTKPIPDEKVDALQEFRKLIAPEDIIEAACRLGAIQRQRKVDMSALVEATIAAVMPTHGAQTTAFANYISLTGQRLAPSAFYDRFSEQFAALMREVAMRAVKAVRELTPSDRRFDDFGVLLEEFSDVQVVDATSHIIRRLAPDAGSKSRPGIKWHSLISLKDDLPVGDAVTNRHTADIRALPQEALQSGTLTLMDLGYQDYGLFIDAVERNAHFLTRLKRSGNPVIVKVHVGKGDRQKLRGMRLNEVVEGRRGQDPAGFLGLERGAIDLDVRIENGDRSAIVRAVAIGGDDGELYWYLTSVERDVLSPDDVSTAYRLRWNVELLFKQLKSGTGLNAVASGRRSATTAMLYAKLIAICLARLLELSLEEREGRHATTQLALVIALTRCAPLLLSMMMMNRGVTFAQLEERIMLIAEITARSRNQRRERARRKREKSLGTA